MPNDIEEVKDPAALLALVNKLAGAEIVAFDTEFLREKTFYPKLCLLQLAFKDTLSVVDPLAVDAQPLLEALVDGAHTLLVHAGEQDVEILWRATGRLPKKIFDTQAAGAMLGLGEQAGYAALVEKKLGVVLEKQHQRLDWSRRPIPESAIVYAADDVRHLRPLYKAMRADLESRGRFAWAEEESLHLLEEARYAPDYPRAYRKVKGQNKVSGAGRGVLVVLARWREETARGRDLPRKRVLPDEILVDVARAKPRNRSGLERIRGMERARLAEDGDTILALVDEGLKLPREEWAPRTEGAPLTPDEEALADVLMGLARLFCAREEVSAATVVTRGELQALLRGARDLPVLAGWRADLVGRALVDFLEGKVRLGVDAGRVEVVPRT